MPLLIEAFLFGVVLPGAITLGLLFFRAGWVTGLALAVGFAAGYLALFGFPAFPPVETSHWVFYLAGIAAVLGALDSFKRIPVWLRVSAALTASMILPLILLLPLIANNWTPLTGILVIAGSGLAILGLWVLLDRLAEHVPGVSIPFTLALLGLGTSLVLVFSGTFLLGQLGGLLTSVLGAVVVMAFFRRNLSLSRGAVPVVVLLLAALWLEGLFFADLPFLSALLLLAVPAAAWAVDVLNFHTSSPWKEAALRISAPLVVVALAVVVS